MPDPSSRSRWPFPRRQRDPLLVRAGSTRKRDAYKFATAGFTGATAFGALAVTGAVAGTAAHQQALDQAQKAQPTPAPRVVVLKPRPHRTVVRTKVVHEVSTAVARPSTGGSVTSYSSSSHSSGSTSTHTTSHTSTSHTTTHASAPKPAAPAPAPAPSSGS